MLKEWKKNKNKFSPVQSNLVYTTPSILRHIFARPNFLVQNSFYTTTTLDNASFTISILSYEVVDDAKISFIDVMYI